MKTTQTTPKEKHVTNEELRNYVRNATEEGRRKLLVNVATTGVAYRVPINGLIKKSKTGKVQAASNAIAFQCPAINTGASHLIDVINRMAIGQHCGYKIIYQCHLEILMAEFEAEQRKIETFKEDFLKNYDTHRASFRRNLEELYIENRQKTKMKGPIDRTMNYYPSYEKIKSAGLVLSVVPYECSFGDYFEAVRQQMEATEERQQRENRNNNISKYCDPIVKALSSMIRQLSDPQSNGVNGNTMNSYKEAVKDLEVFMIVEDPQISALEDFVKIAHCVVDDPVNSFVVLNGMLCFYWTDGHRDQIPYNDLEASYDRETIQQMVDDEATTPQYSLSYLRQTLAN